jgi:anti-sigma factor RsiW
MSESDRPKPDERLTAYLDGQLDPQERSEVQRLIETDSEWQRELAELEQLSRQIASLPRYEAPAGLVQRTLEQIEREPPAARVAAPAMAGSRAGNRVKRVAMAVCGLAALLAAIMVVPSLWTQPEVGQLPVGRQLSRRAGVEATDLDSSVPPESGWLSAEYAAPKTPSEESSPAISAYAEPLVEGPVADGNDSPDAVTRSRAMLGVEPGNSPQLGDMEREELQRAERANEQTADFFAQHSVQPPVLMISVASSDPTMSSQDLVVRLTAMGWKVEPLAEDAFLEGGTTPPVPAEGAVAGAESREPNRTEELGLRQLSAATPAETSWFHVETTTGEAERVLQELRGRHPELRMTSRLARASAAVPSEPPWSRSMVE